MIKRFDGENAHDEFWNCDMVMGVLRDMPPVTPQQKYDEDIAKAFQFGIAIGFGESHDEMDKVIDEIKKVIAPQPKTGHWIRWYEIIENECCTTHNPHCKCSECGTEYDPHISQFIKYCNECGAKMERRQSV